jgi:two-component system phosphate regulon response regulator PhoB
MGPTEFKLLHYFMQNSERVHSRGQLLDKVWGDHVFIEERTVDVHMTPIFKLAGIRHQVRCLWPRGLSYDSTIQG